MPGLRASSEMAILPLLILSRSISLACQAADIISGTGECGTRILEQYTGGWHFAYS